MAKKIAIISTKGGVGKTTLTANLGAALADLGLRVLMIDCDQQQSLSKYYPLQHVAQNGLTHLVQRASAENCISKTTISDNLDIVVNDDPDNQLRDWMRQSGSNVHYLASALQSIDKDYDVILMDTKGSAGLGDLQEIAIRASDMLLSPFSPDWLPAKELVNTIQTVQRLEPPPGIQAGREIPPLTLLVYGQKRTTDNQMIADSVREGDHFQNYFRLAHGKFSVLKTAVPHVEPYNKASGERMPIHKYEPKRPGPTPSGAETILAIIHELFPHLNYKCAFDAHDAPAEENKHG